MTTYTVSSRTESLIGLLGPREEDATVAKIEALHEAFKAERLRWLIGKGDLLVQKGVLNKERFAKLLELTVREEFERNYVLGVLAGGPRTVTEIAQSTGMPKYVTLQTLLALKKWGKVDVTAKKDREYVYARRELSSD